MTIYEQLPNHSMLLTRDETQVPTSVQLIIKEFPADSILHALWELFFSELQTLNPVDQVREAALLTTELIRYVDKLPICHGG